jgi:hypothetical protein
VDDLVDFFGRQINSQFLEKVLFEECLFEMEEIQVTEPGLKNILLKNETDALVLN